MLSNRQTDTHTDPTTVTLAAHARRGLTRYSRTVASRVLSLFHVAYAYITIEHGITQGGFPSRVMALERVFVTVYERMGQIPHKVQNLDFFCS